MTTKISQRIASRLANQHELTSEKRDIVRFALEILFLNVGNLFLTLIIGGLLGVFRETLACIITVALFRHTAGGAHSASPLRCTVGTMIIFPSLALLAAKLSLMNPQFKEVLTFAVIIIGFLGIILLAPVDTPAAPIKSPLRRERLRVFAISTMVLVTVLIISLDKSSWTYAPRIQMCLIIGTLWASFNLTRAGHVLWTFIDRISFKKRKEV